jgi:putative ABC transport system permease protein
MRFLHLVWRSLLRHKIRTAFTLLSVLVAFVLFAFLMAIRMAFTLGIDVAGDDRLMLIHKVSIIQPLPASYLARIEKVEGVRAVAEASWFGGIYQDPANFFPQIPVDPDRYLAMYPEFVVSAEARKAWAADRTGAIVGRAIADRFGWKVGSRVPIQGTIWRPKSGGTTWEFNIVGIYEAGKQGTDTTQFLFRHDFFDENRSFGEGLVGWYIIRIADPARSVEISRAIDALFANSPAETKTMPEKAFVAGFANQIGNIGAMMMAIVSAVFFTILLVAGNTMAQSVRERTSELAVLKTLGFSDERVLGLVLLESFLLAGLGGGIGLGLGWGVITLMGDPTGGFLPAFYLPIRHVALGFVFVALLGLLTGLLPALQAMRLRIVDALRHA